MTRPANSFTPIAASNSTSLRPGIFDFASQAAADAALKSGGFKLEASTGLYRRAQAPKLLAVSFATNHEGRAVWRVNVGEA